MAVTWHSVSVRTQDPLAMITGVEVVGLKLFSVFEGDEWVLRPTVRLAARWIGCHLAAVRLAWREGL